MNNSNKVSNSNCSYTSLQNYNGFNNSNNNQSMMMNFPDVYNKQNKIVIPVYGTVGYNALDNGFPGYSGVGYMNVTKAYGDNCNS